MSEACHIIHLRLQPSRPKRSLLSALLSALSSFVTFARIAQLALVNLRLIKHYYTHTHTISLVQLRFYCVLFHRLLSYARSCNRRMSARARARNASMCAFEANVCARNL